VIDLLIRAVAVGVGVGLGRELVGRRNFVMPLQSSPPGWYPDPWREAPLRWWNRQWTGYTHDGGGTVFTG
jgi:hypothetical protein